MHIKLFKLTLVILLLIPGLSIFPVKTLAEVKIAQLLAHPQVYDLNNVVVTYKDNPGQPKLISLDGSKGLDRHPLPSDSLNQSSPGFAAKQVKLQKIMSDYMDDPEVASVQPQYVYKIDSWVRNGNTDTPDDFDLNPSATPTPDPSTGNHWYYEKEHLRELWKDENCQGSGTNCGGSQNIIVAVIDTGLAYENRTNFYGDAFTKNDDLFTGGNIHLWQNTAEISGNAGVTCSDLINTPSDSDGIRDDCYGLNARQYVYCTPSDIDVPCTTNSEWAEEGHPDDDMGHGTYVTGLIASLVDNASGSVSPAFNVSIMPIKASDKDAPTFGSAEIAAAIDFAITHGADVINMSLGGASPLDSVVQTKIQQAHDAGIIIVAASGNGNTAIDYPAAYSGVIAVGAVNADGSKSSYSNFGPGLSVSAYVGDGTTEGNAVYQSSYPCYYPDILSPDHCFTSGNFSTTNPIHSPLGYQIGTSFAAPQVSALAAILLSEQPALSPDQLKNFIQTTATDLGAGGFDNNTGWGAIDFHAAYVALVGDVPPAITVDQPDGTGDTSNTTYDIHWTDNDPDDNTTVNIYLDTDTTPDVAPNQHLVPGCTPNLVVNDPAPTAHQCTFNSRFIPNGDYFIYACINDFRLVPICDYGAGPVTVANSVMRDFGKTVATSTYKHVDFAVAFTQIPVVVAQATSNYGIDKVYYNLKNITLTGFDVQVSESTAAGYDGIHQPEELSWYAVQNDDADEQIGFKDITQLNPNVWTSVSFYPAFGSAPKVFGTFQSENGTDIAYMNFRNVTANGFEMRLEEPLPLDSIHKLETAGWIAFVNNSSAATNTGLVTSVTHNWKPVTFPAAFTEPPVLLAEAQTRNGTDRFGVDIRNLSKTGFEIRAEEDPRQSDGLHGNENFAYAAFQYLMPRQSAKITVNSSWIDIPFDKPFGSIPKIFAEIDTENGPDTAEVDLRNITPAKFSIRVEEDVKSGWDGSHGPETITYLAMTSPGTEEQLGTVSVAATAINNTWITVPFPTAYPTPLPTPPANPLVVFTEIQTENGGDTAQAHTRNVTSTSFDVRLEEDPRSWDGNHTSETIAWLAFEVPFAGQSGSITPTPLSNVWTPVVFPTPFASIPKLLVDLNTENGTETAMPDVRNETINGFEIRVEEQPKRYDGLHGPETLAWLAWP